MTLPLPMAIPAAPEQVDPVAAGIRACIARGPGLSLVAAPELSRAMPTPPRLDEVLAAAGVPAAGEQVEAFGGDDAAR